MYRIYTKVNYADTCRDPDNIHIEDFGYVDTKEEAIEFMKKFIKEEFFLSEWSKGEIHSQGDNLCAYEVRSWGRTLCADVIKKIKE